MKLITLLLLFAVPPKAPPERQQLHLQRTAL